MSDYLTNIQMALDTGKINPYMAQRLAKISPNGMDDKLFGEILSDAQNASDVGVDEDKKYNQYFYLCHFLNDILKDTFGTKLDDEKSKYDFCKSYFASDNENYNLSNLTDLRVLVHKWLCGKMSKNAHPNIAGKYTREPTYDLNKWVLTLNEAFALSQTGLDRTTAINNTTADWDIDEKSHFQNWIKYYEEGNTEKYKVKTAKFIKEAFGPLNLPESLLTNRNPTAPQISTFHADDYKSKKELELDRAKALKTKMKSRVRALKILIDKYNDILPNQDLEKLFVEVHNLEKSISKLNVYASLQDSIIRTANKMVKLGFSEGADLLFKTAAEPPTDASVVQSLPAPAPSTPNLPTDSASMINIQTIIARLDGVNKRLASRDLIRELASVDILLNEIGLASYFPELSLAQSKLIEAFGYANNKVEDVTARLRGTGTSKPVKLEPVPLPTAPLQKQDVVAPKAPENVKKEELLEKPVGKVETTLPPPAKKQ